MKHALVVLLVLALCSLASPAVCMTPDSVSQAELRQLQRRAQRAYQAERWDDAVEAGEQLAALLPENGTAAYNAACMHSRAGNADEALVWLTEAGQRGFSGIATLATDPDLDPIRAHESFDEAVAPIHAARDTRFAEFKAMAERAKPITIFPEGHDASQPAGLLIVLHGLGGRPEPIGERYRLVASEFNMILVTPSALRRYADGFSWTFRDEAEWLVLRIIKQMSEQHTIDPSRIVLSGFSQGASISLEIGIKHPATFAGIIPLAGYWSPDDYPLPETDDKPRMYLMVGARDQSADNYRQAKHDLIEAGWPVKLKVYPGLAHAYPRGTTRELRKALGFVLQPD